VTKNWSVRAGVLRVAIIVAISFVFLDGHMSSAEKLRISYASITGNTAVTTYVAQPAGLSKPTAVCSLRSSWRSTS